QSKVWHAGAGRWTSLGMGERVVLVRACMLSPTSKRSDRLTQLATNAISRCGPVSLRSHGLRATFLLRSLPATASGDRPGTDYRDARRPPQRGALCVYSPHA